MHNPQELVKARIKSIFLHPVHQMPVVFLVDKEGTHVIPMTIGHLEAQSIISAWRGLPLSRPTTADLLHSLIEQDFGAFIKRVVIRDIAQGAYYADVVIERDGEEIIRDARPSDALSLVVRSDAPLYLSHEVIRKTKHDQDNTHAMHAYLEAESEDSEGIIRF